MSQRWPESRQRWPEWPLLAAGCLQICHFLNSIALEAPKVSCKYIFIERDDDKAGVETCMDGAAWNFPVAHLLLQVALFAESV